MPLTRLCRLCATSSPAKSKYHLLTVGLTGGIGSGKSSVSARLAVLGAVVIDADRIAREIVEPGEPALTAIHQRFGDAVISVDGTLKRQDLAEIVFNDPKALADLNAIMLPRIAARTHAEQEAAPEDAVVVHDSPLLVEQGLDDAYDVILVVDCPDDVRIDRLVSQRGMTEIDARARMAAQASRDDRLAVADFVIENDGSPDELRHRVDEVWQLLREAAEENC